MKAVLPAYGSGFLGDVLPSIASRLGVSSAPAIVNIPASDRYVVLLIDGLGWELLADSADDAPFLHSLLPEALELTSTCPSTTATALTALGTGLTPGQHGIAGYTFRHPFEDKILNSLAWEYGLSAIDVQPRMTMFERLDHARILTWLIQPEAFQGSGLTEAGQRGGSFMGVSDERSIADRVEKVVDAALSGPKTAVYCYERSLDHEGHLYGVDSFQWRNSLEWCDQLASAMRQALPDDVTLLIAADHGMVDVPADARLVIEDVAELNADVALIGGEARLRHLFIKPGRLNAAVARWRDVLGENAWVRTLDEAVDEGWFGTMLPEMRRRFGDIVVASRGNRAIETIMMPNESRLIGMHGSLTPVEMRVPLLMA